MSLQKTTLKIELSKVIAALPARSTVEKIVVNYSEKPVGHAKLPESIEIVWSNDDIPSKFSVATEYPLEKLIPTVDKSADAVRKKAKT